MGVIFDFTGLTPGFLPAGSVFTVFDLDVLEALNGLMAFDLNSSQITTPWLSLVAQFDANGAISGQATSFATLTPTAGVYSSNTAGVSGDIPTLYFVTTQDIRAVMFDGVSDNGPRGYSVAFGTSPVPEPGTWGLAAASLGLLCWRRRQAR